MKVFKATVTAQFIARNNHPVYVGIKAAEELKAQGCRVQGAITPYPVPGDKLVIETRVSGDVVFTYHQDEEDDEL